MGLTEKRTHSNPKGLNLFVISGFFLSILPAISIWFFPWHHYSDTNNLSGMVALIVINGLMWLISGLIIIYLLKIQNTLKPFFQFWKKQLLLLCFILIAFFSIFWSISPLISTYKVIVLLGSTLLGAYIGSRFEISRWLDFLFWFGAVLIILCFAFVFMFPGLGTMPQPPYYGAWCGIFWNRNQMGILMALINSIILFRTFSEFNKKNGEIFIDGFFYILSLWLIYKASSATGYILTIVLTAMIFCIFLWLKYHAKLQKKHYAIALVLLIVFVIVIFINFEFVLGLFNRSASLTGRIPMWTYLFQNVFSKSPWLGYGFGAVWSSGPFRNGLSQVVGWRYPVTIGDNGFIDISLYVGIVGLILFLGVLFSALMRSIKLILNRPAIINFFPIVFLVFALLANVSFSLFFETESLIWIILVALLFMSTEKEETTSFDHLPEKSLNSSSVVEPGSANP